MNLHPHNSSGEIHPDRHNRNGGSPLQTSRYSEQEIAQANAEHDSRMGFSLDCQSVFTNPYRRPESVAVPPDEAWDKMI